MSQDITADVLNEIMNAKRAGKEEVICRKYSKFLLEVLKVAKENGYIDEISTDEEKHELKVKIGNLNKCSPIKPRYFVKKEDIEGYARRFLPSRNFGILIISTSQGVLTQKEINEKQIGGSLVAYFY